MRNSLLDFTTINILSENAPITPEPRHFIARQTLEVNGQFYHHWPSKHCGHHLHSMAVVEFCQQFLEKESSSTLVYDSGYPAARGATPLLQSLLSHSPGFIEAWGVCSGVFSKQAACRLAKIMHKPRHRLLYIHDPMKRLSSSEIQQNVTMTLLTFDFGSEYSQ